MQCNPRIRTKVNIPAKALSLLLMRNVFGNGSHVTVPFRFPFSSGSIRGRLCSFFTLTMNTGIMVGFVVSSHVAYDVIPCAVVGLPVLYVFLATRFPEPPQQLIRWQREEEAQRSLRFYRRCDGPNVSKEAERAYQKQFDEMRLAIQQQSKDSDDKALSLGDFCKCFLRFLIEVSP